MIKTLNKILILTIASTLITGCWEVEKGEKVGNLVKLAKAGLFFKTNEAELIRGGLTDASGSMGTPFYFTIENDELLAKAQKALDERKAVRIKYHQEFATLWRTETQGYFLDAIEIIN